LFSISEGGCRRLTSRNADVRDDTRIHVPQVLFVSNPASPAEIATNCDPAVEIKLFAMMPDKVPPKFRRRSQWQADCGFALYVPTQIWDPVSHIPGVIVPDAGDAFEAIDQVPQPEVLKSLSEPAISTIHCAALKP